MSQRRIGFLTCASLLANDGGNPEDVHEHEVQTALFTQAATARDLSLEVVQWDAANINWSRYDAVLLGTAWDYVQHLAAFIQRMSEISRQTKLFNDLALLIMNSDKGYLLDLAAKGIATIPTRSVQAVTKAEVTAAFSAFGGDRLVAKPIIGASAWRQALLRKNEPLPDVCELPPGPAFLQPFLPSIQTIGETSLLFYDGVFSHSVQKTPSANDYRIQSVYGGKETMATPTPAQLQLARNALTALDQMPLYARVDLVAGFDGEPLLIELELIEPYHYVEQGPNCGAMLMDALVRRLAS